MSVLQESPIARVKKKVYYISIDAIIKRMEATSRMKDFFDIYYLSGMFNFEGRKLQEAIFHTFEHRGTIYESDSFGQKWLSSSEKP